MNVVGSVAVDATDLAEPNVPGDSILHQSVDAVEQEEFLAPIVNFVETKQDAPSASVGPLTWSFSPSQLVAFETTRLTTSARFDSTSTGLQFRVHYDSSEIDLVRTADGAPIIHLTSAFADQLSGVQVSTDCINEQHCYGLDGDQQTDAYVSFLWLDHNGHWPADLKAVVELVSINLATQDGFSGTTVRFTGDLAGGIELSPGSETLHLREDNFGDVNQDSQLDARDIDFLVRCDSERGRRYTARPKR